LTVTIFNSYMQALVPVYCSLKGARVFFCRAMQEGAHTPWARDFISARGKL
jgi:hypothetical protein